MTKRALGAASLSTLAKLMTDQEPSLGLGMCSRWLQSLQTQALSGGNKCLKGTFYSSINYYRAARGQGVTFAVLTHESRALTEDKQRTALAPSTEEERCNNSSSKLSPLLEALMAGEATE